ncbi:long chain base biosynthesis protein 2a-like [Pyrus ussuriensis x Pyrus communis]|uniref:Long chain base biosynthesis protein 2a-like n=1 Tax=Pyrus ussuriensis x Pyrus communis TaxID=2448454 RepID=A0A5N5H4V5_9ROSA|nr:long chain base biosynthesis protein 2a-like [Pyrus ussuriensis x Pyrus communis]
MIAIPYLTTLTKYFSYGLLFVFGQVRDFFRKMINWWSAGNLQDYFNRPIASVSDAWFNVVERYSNDYNKTLKLTKKTSRRLNLGSYNYLGFAASDEYCTPRAIETLKKYSPSTCSSRVNGGTMDLHNELEECVANFVGKPAAIVFGMGYVTNSAILPVLMGKGGLIVSDSLNHNSIVNGARESGARVCVFQHNSSINLAVFVRITIKDLGFMPPIRHLLPTFTAFCLLTFCPPSPLAMILHPHPTMYPDRQAPIRNRIPNLLPSFTSPPLAGMPTNFWFGLLRGCDSGDVVFAAGG